MKRLIVLLVVSILVSLSQQKIKLVITNLAQTALKLRGADDSKQVQSDAAKRVTYITILEGSREIYNMCGSICKESCKPLYYTEVTDFPNYGKIFRCQCGDRYSSWYNIETFTALDLDILLGDNLFNDYFNLLGYDTSDCQCDSLKQLLGKMVG